MIEHTLFSNEKHQVNAKEYNSQLVAKQVFKHEIECGRCQGKGQIQRKHVTQVPIHHSARAFNVKEPLS